MPLVSSFFGIKIFMYWDEHLPEHFHAEYGNFKALVGIREAAVFRGTLPARQLKLVLAWCELHQDELLVNWNSARENGPIVKIAPIH